MNLHQERYFFLSGVISFSLFIIILFLVGYGIVLSPKVQQFAMTKSDYISVSIMSAAKPKETPQPVNVALTPLAQPVHEEVPEAKAETVPDISDLFSQVKPQKALPKKSDNTKRNDELNALEKELNKRTDSPRFTDKLNKLELVKPSVKMIAQGGSSGPVVNEYHAKIQGLVYTYFHPPSGTAGQIARVRMNISADGKLLSYKVLAYSGNAMFNGEVDWLKERLSTIVFPKHPEGKEAVLEFILTAKE